jgi:hypothetical protein
LQEVFCTCLASKAAGVIAKAATEPRPQPSPAAGGKKLNPTIRRNNMENFEFANPTRIIFGKSTENQIGQELKGFKKVLTQA